MSKAFTEGFMGIVKVIVFKSVYASCVQVMVVEDFHKYPTHLFI